MKKLLLFFALFLSFSNIALAVDKIDVYYFYSKPRCTTCTKIENYTKSAVESLGDKSITYSTVDMQKPENDKAVKKYKLFTKSVIISKNKNGKETWKNLDKIWLKVSNEKEFKKYIVSEIQSFKGGK